MVRIEGEILQGYFHNRINRFIGKVYINNELVNVHIPNTGRMKELLVKDAKVLVRRVNDSKRKTKYDLLMVYKDNELVAIDSRLPNTLLYNGFTKKEIDYFTDYYDVKREVNFGNSRFDIGLIGNRTNTLIEAKCVTLVENKVAKFPDAPTERGVKHLRELIKAKEQGFEAGVFFIVQRKDANVFIPNWDMDTEFSLELNNAYKKGVIVKAIKCKVTMNSVSLYKEIDVTF